MIGMNQEKVVIYNLINTIDRMSLLNDIERRLSFMDVGKEFLNKRLSGEIDDFIDGVYDCDGILAFTEKNDRMVLNINNQYFVIAHSSNRKINVTDFYISRYEDARDAYERFCGY